MLMWQCEVKHIVRLCGKGQDMHTSRLRADKSFVVRVFSALTSSVIPLGGGHKTAVSRCQERPEWSRHCTYCASCLFWLHPCNIVLSLTRIKPWNQASGAPAGPDHLIHMPWQASSQPLSPTDQRTHVHVHCKFSPCGTDKAISYLTWKPES